MGQARKVAVVVTAPALVAFGSEGPTALTGAEKRPSPLARPSSPLCKNLPPDWLWIGYHCRLDKDLRSRYGITCSDYWELFSRQDGVCVVCGRQPGKKRLVPDHDHETGLIEGLLHLRCNRQITQRVRQYLADPPGREVGLVVPPAKRRQLEAAHRAQQRKDQAKRKKPTKAPPTSNGSYREKVAAARQELEGSP